MKNRLKKLLNLACVTIFSARTMLEATAIWQAQVLQQPTKSLRKIKTSETEKLREMAFLAFHKVKLMRNG